MITCSCGTHENHEVARRTTLDGKRVVLWSDGLVTGAMGWGIKGVGAARTAYETSKNIEAGWLAFDEIDLYEYTDVGRLVRSARAAVRQASQEPRRYMRAKMAGATFKAVKRGAVIRHSNRCACIGCLKDRLAAGLGGDPTIHRPGK